MSSRSRRRHRAERHGNAPVLTKTQARQAVTPHVTRNALGWGPALVIAAFPLIYLFHHLSHP